MHNLDDKRAVTGVVSGTYDGTLLPLQIIYQGKTTACEPSPDTYPSDFDITHTESHWSNKISKFSFFNNVLKPYVDKKRAEQGYGQETYALIIFDFHKSNLHKELYEYMEKENWCFKLVPERCTDFCQPMDLSVNGAFKRYLRQEWTNWYGQQFMMQLKSGRKVNEVNIDTTLTYLKPIHAQWVIKAFTQMKQNKKLMMRGWELMGLNKSGAKKDGEEKKND